MHDARDTGRTRANIRKNPPSNVIALRPFKAATIIPALSDPLADDAPKGRFVDQINAVAQQWAAAGAPWAVAARKPTTPKPQPRPAAGVPLDRTLERARTIIELAEAWGVDLRLALAMGKGTAASPTARPAASIPPDAPNVLPFRAAAMTEARP
jgi:hypothetical protein